MVERGINLRYIWIATVIAMLGIVIYSWIRADTPQSRAKDVFTNKHFKARESELRATWDKLSQKYGNLGQGSKLP